MWKIMPINMNMFFEQRMAGNAQGIADQDPQLKQLQGYINYEPSREAVLSKLLPDYLNGYLNYMLINSAEGEQAARQIAMHNATENARELLDDLKLITITYGRMQSQLKLPKFRVVPRRLLVRSDLKWR